MDSGFVNGQVRVVRLENLPPRQRQRVGCPLGLFTDTAGIQRWEDEIHILQAIAP